MTLEAYGQWMGRPMDERDVDDLLDSTGWGVLSLADGDEPYSIPVSFGYDGEAVYFALIRDRPGNRKFEFVENGATARLLVTDVGGRFDWASVAVTGPLRPVPEDGPEWDDLLDVLGENAWFSTGFERADGVESLQGWQLAPRKVHGLEVTPDRA